MTLCNHKALASASAKPLPVSGKDEKEETHSDHDVDELHQKQAEYLLSTCCLPEESPKLQKKLNRTVLPGECLLEKDCPSFGISEYPCGKSRGDWACDHSFPTEFHVAFNTCPQADCGELFSAWIVIQFCLLGLRLRVIGAVRTIK